MVYPKRIKITSLPNIDVINHLLIGLIINNNISMIEIIEHKQIRWVDFEYS